MFQTPPQLSVRKCTDPGVSPYPSAAVFQENVNIFFVFKVVVKLHYVLMMQDSVKLNFFVNLRKRNSKIRLLSLPSSLERRGLHMQETFF